MRLRSNSRASANPARWLCKSSCASRRVFALWGICMEQAFTSMNIATVRFACHSCNCSTGLHGIPFEIILQCHYGEHLDVFKDGEQLPTEAQQPLSKPLKQTRPFSSVQFRCLLPTEAEHQVYIRLKLGKSVAGACCHRFSVFPSPKHSMATQSLNVETVDYHY